MPDEPTSSLRLGGQPVVRYLAVVLAVGVPLLAIPVAADLPVEPSLLVITYGLLLGGAILTARRGGPGSVRGLFGGALRWRVDWRHWALAVGALPLATLAVAAVTGSLVAPPDGWWATVGSYLFATLIFGTLLLNLWEEIAWTGLVQRHFMQRHGLLKGSMITAIPFALLHVPLAWSGAVTTRQALVALALVILMAPALRYLIGRTDRSTGGSLLLVGILHASFNASGSLDVLDGGWQHVAGLAIVAAAALLADAVRSRTSVAGAPDYSPV